LRSLDVINDMPSPRLKTCKDMMCLTHRLIVGLKVAIEAGECSNRKVKSDRRELQRREYKLRTEREQHKANMTRLERLDGHVAEKDSQISTLREEIKKARNQISELEQECQNRRATEARLVRSTEDAEKEIALLKKQNVEQVADMNAFLALELELAEQKDATKKKKQKIKKLNKKLDDQQAYYKKKIDSLKQTKKSLQQTIEDMKNESAQRVHEIAALKYELNKGLAKVEILKHSDETSEHVLLLNQQIRKGLVELEQSERRYQEAKRELEGVSKENAGLQYFFQNSQRECFAAKKDRIVPEKIACHRTKAPKGGRSYTKRRCPYILDYDAVFNS